MVVVDREIDGRKLVVVVVDEEIAVESDWWRRGDVMGNDSALW